MSVVVPPPCKETLTSLLTSAQIHHSITVEDVQAVIEAEKQPRSLPRSSSARSTGGSWSYDAYHDMEEIYERMSWLVRSHPHLLSSEELGRTHENRSIEVLIVREPGPHTKPVIWLDCGIHAREWITPPACLYAVDKLVEMWETSDNLLSIFDFYVLPVVNPDGYVYTWGPDRFWRGNRNKNYTHNNCHGVDLNRNFPDFKDGSREEEVCSITWRGDAPFSEPESRAIRDGLAKIIELYGPNKIAAYVSIHSFSQLWLSPYGYTYDKPVDYNDQLYVMHKTVEALKSNFGTEYTYGPASDLYLAPGISIDWTYDQMGIKYSFTPELRPKNTGSILGFALPPEQILDTVMETWTGLAAMALEIAPEFGKYCHLF